VEVTLDIGSDSGKMSKRKKPAAAKRKSAKALTTSKHGSRTP
jgi:hypothetical protein